jgi:hypothetical protein
MAPAMVDAARAALVLGLAFVSGCFDVYDEARSHAGVTVCSGCLGADNMPHSLVGRVVIVTMDHMCSSSVGDRSPLLVDRVWMVTPSGG